mmetsp:Transcript_25625/g.66523  ORF Transcript_25625/g.66523 Transcript_25625/m.66523 type:complete len:397 (-) Transcript_25625:7-1197(-)
MLDLDARIHFNKKMFIRFDIHQKLDRARVLVARGLAQPHGVVLEALPQAIVQIPRRRDLDDLLVPPLHAAVALPEVDHIISVADNLDFHMSRIFDVPLEETRPVPERRERFGRGALELRLDLVQRPRDAHALAAAAHQGLDHDGQAELLRERARLLRGVERVVRAGHDGHVRRDGHLSCRNLVREGQEVLDRRAHERNAALAAQPREFRRLGQEAIARVDRFHALALGDVHDGLRIQVRADGRVPRRQQKRLVRAPPVRRVPVLHGVDADRRHVQLRAGAHDAHGDLGAVRGHHFIERRDLARLLGDARVVRLDLRHGRDDGPARRQLAGGGVERRRDGAGDEAALESSHGLRCPPPLLRAASSRFSTSADRKATKSPRARRPGLWPRVCSPLGPA